MGHERVGVLPKSKRWRDIVGQIAESGYGRADVTDIARDTIKGVANRLAFVQRDPGVVSSFAFLVALAVASRSDDPRGVLAGVGILLPGNTTPLALAKAVHRWVPTQDGSVEYRELAKAAVVDAIGDWADANRPSSTPLFSLGDEAFDLWRPAGTPSGFCELSRLFFAHFTERYLSYFLEREASAALPSVEHRDDFKRQLRSHVDLVSQHAFETAKITQSFSAGWFAKSTANGMPSEESIGAFLAVAFRKMRAELSLESNR
jgi:hypothetical protein